MNISQQTKHAEEEKTQHIAATEVTKRQQK